VTVRYDADINILYTCSACVNAYLCACVRFCVHQCVSVYMFYVVCCMYVCIYVIFFAISDVSDVNGQRHCLSILPIKIEFNLINKHVEIITYRYTCTLFACACTQ
jgi:hypothetical protein